MVGGADIYKAQDVGGGGGYDEFLQDFDKQVQPPLQGLIFHFQARFTAVPFKPQSDQHCVRYGRFLALIVFKF